MTYLLTVYLQGKDVASVKALLVFGADINGLNGSGQTPLDIAVRDDNMEMMEYLATLGAFTGEYMLQLQQAWALEGLHLGKDKDGKEAGITDVAMSVKLQGKDKNMTVADLEIQKGGFSHWRAKRASKFWGCHAHFRSRWKPALNTTLG